MHGGPGSCNSVIYVGLCVHVLLDLLYCGIILWIYCIHVELLAF